jgi:thioredoxin reductase/NAD-dependent dihydropyrimidine dehydrogenase PreA subunit
MLIWLMAGAVVGAIVVPYFVSFRRRNSRDAARKQEAAKLGIDRPLSQFPYIDATWCIGCGACVTACPEGDVLGIVGGTAAVINGLRCIGHGLCETACPVGAIEVGLGDLKSRADIPLMGPDHETSVPGLFVVGELGGLALFKNAVTQGRRVGAHIARRARSRGRASEGLIDVAVVGAGPAGISAALTALEQGLRPLVLEQEQHLGGTVLHYPRRKLVLVQTVDLPMATHLPGAEYTKEDLLELLERLIVQAGLEIRFGHRVTDVRREDGLFVLTAGESTVRARFVVLALGRRGTPRKLGVPGEQLPKVMYKLVDAASYQHQRILVVGGGDSAVEAAIGLAGQRGNKVTLSYRKDRLVRIKQKNEERFDRLAASGKIELSFSSEVTEILPGYVRLRTAGGPVEIGNDCVFVFAGGDPPLGLLNKIGIQFGGGGAERSAVSA